MKRLTLLFCAVWMATVSIAQRTETTIWSVKNYTEATARSYLDGNYYLDPVEGIWQSTDGFKYAIEKDVENSRRQNDKYRVVILESSVNGWTPSQIKAFISLGSVDGVYSMKYYTNNAYGNSLSSQNVILVQESPILMTFQRMDTNDKISMYKLYPKASDNSAGRNSSNSGFSASTEEKRWSGSSIVIGRKYLATNYHVVEDAKSLFVCGVSGSPNTEYTAEVIASDKYNDLAIVKITDYRFSGFNNIKYGTKTSTIDVGSSIFVLGYPLTSTMGEEIKLTTGVISSKSGFQGDVSQYQISAAVQPGNSGGPLFDDKGYLVGIVSAKHTGAENVGYAIKLSYLKNLIESIDERIDLPISSNLTANTLSEQVKAISPYVLMIKASNVAGSSTYSGQNKRQDGSTHNSNSGLGSVSDAKKILDACGEKFSNGDYSGAYVDACRSVELYPTPDSHYFRGFLAFNYAKNYEQAVESFLYCIEKGHRLEASYIQLGNTYYAMEKYADAITTYDKVININIRNVEALYMRGLCKSNLDNRQGAIADYKQAIKYEGIVESNYATIYNNIAYSYVEINDLENAKPYIKEALKRDHNTWFIWDTDGELAYKLGNYEDCINSMNNAITISNKNDNSYLYRGLAKIKLNQLADGYNDLSRAKELGNEEAAKELSMIDASSIDFSESLVYSEVYTSPTIKKGSKPNLKIVGVETTNESTIFYMEYTNTQYVSDGWYSIDPDTYIRDKNTGRTYTLLSASNCAISPRKTSIEKGETAKFALFFPAISKGCNSVDFVESEKSEWKFYGIQLK